MTTTAQAGGMESAKSELHPATKRWLPIQRIAVLGFVVPLVAVQVIVQELIPILAIACIPFVVAGLATYRWPRGGGIAIGVLSLLAFLAFLPDIVRDTARPASIVTYSVTAIAAVALLLGIAGGVMLIAKREATAFLRTMQAGATAAVVVLLVIGIGARITLDSHAAEPGDIRVTVENVYFVPDTMTAEAGTIAVHVDNRDWGHHDFVIEELGVTVELYERSARRFEFDAPAGVYEVICTLPGHSRMTMTLTVE